MDNVITYPKITVLMSVYNGGVYLKSAIESILFQTFKDFEFIILNDASKDNSREVIKTYDDKRIRFVDNDVNLGLTRSLNKGIELARGKYIARQDADDMSMPDRLEKMFNFMEENPEVGLLGTSFIRVDENDEVFETRHLKMTDEEIRKVLIKENHFGFEMFRRDVLIKVGGYRNEFKYAQDYDLALRIAEKTRVANLDEFLYKYRITIDAISISKYYAQMRFAGFAKQLAQERIIKGKDILQTGSENEINEILKLIFKESNSPFAKHLGFYNWGRYYYFKGDIKRAFVFFWKNFPLCLVFKDTSFFLLKITAKILLPNKLVNYIRERIHAKS